ncbi:hypothetical protein SH668x_001854 [Planctomicrobium sp. SH668]|uniref:hypothetical protein n=1 Tax=Planctomicrobium sp. SH668 TaxID=3448126 RepID=UPI003F5C6BF2
MLKHAFAVKGENTPPTQRQQQIVDHLAYEIVRRHLTTPALTFLEMSRPMNFIGSQAMHFFTPIVSTLFDASGYEEFAKLLERRDAIDLIAKRIEELEAQAVQKESQSQ